MASAMVLKAAQTFKKATQGECVRVVVRCRPMNSKETNEGRTRVVDMDVKMGQARGRGRGGPATFALFFPAPIHSKWRLPHPSTPFPDM